jgi:Asp-tRNA(Asn)/Glu-tRNA(Gln) amidotransferase A subunit family amidase
MDFQEAFKKCDFIFSPVCASTAFKLGGEEKMDELHIAEVG